MKLLGLISLLGIITAGCQMKFDLPSPAGEGIDPRFEQSLGSYIAEKATRTGEAQIRGVAMIMVPELEGKTVGQCRKWSNGDREILIDQMFWDLASESLQEQLIMHELGHCDLDREHVTGTAIMSPSLINDWFYKQNRDILLDDLFDNTYSFDTMQQKLLDHEHDDCVIYMD